MSYILVEGLTKTFNEKVILNNISFSIDKGDKVALVARNGSGKSTLLRILQKEEPYDDGRISYQKDLKIAFLDQEPELDLNKTVNEEIFASDSPILRAVRLYEESLEDPNDSEKMQRAFDAMNKYSAWEYEAKVKEILEKLDLHHLNEKIQTFSGGQKKRVALAKLLIDVPDLLILDEPTNHLDLDMIDWLEQYLEEQEITLLMVTHDRYFLERVCNEILELENGNVYKYKGNYSYYLDKKASREENENINIDKTKALLKRELEWVRKQPRGRQSKASARVDAYYDIKNNLKEKNVVEKVKLDVVGSYMGAKILEIHNLTKSFGNKKILDKFTYSFTKGEKVGIIGKNGVGKTTFLNLIMGNEPARHTEMKDFSIKAGGEVGGQDSGKIVKGESVKFGYYSQSGITFNENEKVIDYVKSVAQFIKLSDGTEVSASKMLERFLFAPRVQQESIAKLSGGEKRRLYLLKILMANPNFLILDEPTNDLDIMTLNVLEEFLQEFKGCLIIISHDRYFMDKIVQHLFVFEGDAVVKNFPGNYSQYRIVKESEVNNKPEIMLSNPKPPSSPLRTGLAPNPKLNNNLLKEIEKLERKKEMLSEKINNPKLSFDEMNEISLEIREIVSKIELKSEEWLRLG